MIASDLATIPQEARADLHFWRGIIEPLLAMDRGVTAVIRDLAARNDDLSYATIRRKYDLVRKQGWAAIVDRRLLGPTAWQTRQPIGLPEADKQIVKKYCEDNQRGNDAALDQLRRDWRKGIISTTTPLDIRTGYPRGWSKRNLSLHAPTKFELKNARIGRTAAADDRRLVYTTRANLAVGQYYLFDDMWHDHEVVHLDQLKRGRPLEFHALDLYSANKFAWGARVRTQNDETGKMEGLKEADMRFLLASVLGGTGYNPHTGTSLIVEHGTAAVRGDLEALLSDETGGLIRVERGGMEGASAGAHQYAGRAKGNFRFKAALESLGNLIHNEFAALPGQTGKDYRHAPEQQFGLQKQTDALLKAIAYLPPERAELIRFGMMTLQQHHAIAGEIYARINARTDHDLEGWDMHYVPDPRTGLMRRLNPSEVMHRGRGALTRLSPAATAMILAKDCGVERTVRRSMVELRDSEISGDTLRFDARHLTEGDKVFSILNPYQPDALHCFDAKLRFVAALPRIHSIDRADTDAVMRQVAEASKIEAAALQPFRARHAADARRRAKDARHNAEVVNGPAPKSSRLPANADDFTAPDLDDAPRGSFEDSAGSLADEFADII